MTVVIDYLDYYIPQKKIDSKIILGKNKVNSNQFIKETGIKTINVFDKYELPDAFDNLIDKMFKTKKIKTSDIKYIACETTPLTKYYNISVVHFIQKKYEMDKAKILPLHQPCAFSLLAIDLSRKLLNKDEYMLILCANDWSEKKIKDRFLKFTIMGDGIGIILIKKDNLKKSIKVEECYYESYGISSFNTYNVKKYESEPALNRLSMIKKGVDFIIRSLKTSQKEITDIEKIIVSNVRCDVFINTYSKLLGVPPNFFFLENIHEGGHINDIDLIRNLKDYLSKNKGIRNSKKIIVLYTLDIEESMDINYHLTILSI